MAAADLAAFHIGVADSTVIAPFAGVVHVGLALLEQLAVAAERIDALWRAGKGVDGFDARLVAVVPFDREALLFKQPFVIGDKLRQPLKGSGRFQDEPLHMRLRFRQWVFYRRSITFCTRQFEVSAM